MSSLYQHRFNNRISSIKQNLSNNRLCIETVSDRSDVNYFVTSADDCTTSELSFNIDDQSGMAVHTFIHDLLIFTQYVHNNNPDQMNILAYSINNSDRLWQINDSQILEVGLNYITIPHPHFKNKTKAINIKTGVGFEMDPKPLNLLENAIKLPNLYQKGNEYFSWFERFIADSIKVSAVIECEYLETPNNILISFYTTTGKTLENKLLLADLEGNVIELFTLGQKLTGIGRDTFFILNNRLIFVSNKDTLNVYDL